jgi:hypothetical protein
MKTALALLAMLLVAAAADASAPILTTRDAIPGRYVVVLEEGVARLPGETAVYGPSVPEVADHMARVFRGRVGRTFEHALQGFAVSLSPEDAERLAADPRVAYVAQDGRVRVSETQMDPPSWGLDRIDQRLAPLSGSFTYTSMAESIHVYVVDTGIRSTHLELAGRVDTVEAFSTVDDGLGTEDCHGHGTHVAGVIGGATVGVARGVVLHPVRVLDCTGNGAVSDVVAGIDWLTADVQAHQGHGNQGGRRAVANLSLETWGTWLLDNAVWAAVDAGIPLVAAAGNHGADACDYSPGRMPEAITVGASDSEDRRASFSNQGSCLDLFAPGVSILSSFIRSDTDLVAMTGTSAAAPHVTAVAATVLAAYPEATPAEVERIVQDMATAGVLTDLGTGSPDRLLYSAFLGEDDDSPPSPAFTWRCRVPQYRCTFEAGDSWDDDGIDEFAWDFGDGGSASSKRPRAAHKFSGPGVYSVTLRVTDSAGQSATLVHELELD